MQGLNCPSCGIVDHVQKYSIDGLYVCALCGKILGYLCDGCDRIYTSNRLGLHGDVYECKICGKIQWGYTEYKRDKSE